MIKKNIKMVLWILLFVNKALIEMAAAKCTTTRLLMQDESPDVLEFDPETSQTNLFVSLTRARTVDVHFGLGYIFWSDQLEGKIKRAHLDGTNVVMITSMGGLYPALAVDWKASKLYWVGSSSESGIVQADLDGTNKQQVFSDATLRARDLEIDPDHGLIFWNGLNEIERVNFSGTDRMVVIGSDVRPGVGISLDRQSQRIFWFNFGDTLKSADYAGKKIRTILDLSSTSPAGLAFSSPFLYFTDENGLHKTNPHTGNVQGTYSGSGSLYGVAYNDSCPYSNTTSSSVVMRSLQSIYSAPNCTTTRLLMQAQSPDIYEFDPETSQTSLFVSLFPARDVDVHFGLGYIFWSDQLEGKIKRAHLDGTNAVIITSVSGMFEALAGDWKASQLYWAESSASSGIVKADLDGSNKIQVVSDFILTVYDMEIDHDNGLIFWIGFDEIERATLSGTDRNVIIESDVDHTLGISLDRQTTRIFWFTFIDTLKSANYAGEDMKTLHDLFFSRPTGLAFSSPFVYFIDDNGLHKTNPHTGEIVGNYSGNGSLYDVAYNGYCPYSSIQSTQVLVSSSIMITYITSSESRSQLITSSLEITPSQSPSTVKQPLEIIPYSTFVPQESSLPPIAPAMSNYPSFLITTLISTTAMSLWTVTMSTKRSSVVVQSTESILLTTSLPQSSSLSTISSAMSNYPSLATPTVITRTVMDDSKPTSESRPALVAIIFGGNEVFREQTETLTIDGSLSYDPAAGPSYNTEMTFTWFLGYVTGNYTGNKSPSVISFSALNETHIHYFGIDHCSVITFNTTANVQSISYVFKLVVSKGYRSSSFIQLVHLVKGEPPVLSLSCRINCGLKISPTVKLSIESECIERCSDIVSYEWRIYKANATTTDSEIVWQRIQDFQTITTTPLNSNNIVIKENTLWSGRAYRLSLFVQTLYDEYGMTASEFNTALAPSGGTCTITPLAGIALQTPFNISCYNWTSDAPPLHYQFQNQFENGLNNVIYGGLNSSIVTQLPTGNSSNTYTMKVIANVIDQYSASGPEIILQVQVTPSLLLSPTNLVNLVTANDSLLKKAAENNDREEVVKIANAVIQAMANDSTLHSQDKTKIQDSIIETVIALPVQNIPELLQSSSVIGSVTQDAVTVSVKSLTSSMDSVDVMTSLLKNTTEKKDTTDVPLVGKSAENLGVCLSNLMKAGASLAAHDAGSDFQAQGIDLVKKGALLASDVGDAVLSLTLPDEEVVTIQNRDMVMTLGRHSPSTVVGLEINTGTGKFVLPTDNEDLANMLTNTSFLDTQVSEMQFNPFTWDDTQRRVDSAVLTLDLKDDKGNRINVTNLSSNVLITVPLASQKKPLQNPAFFTKDDKLQFHVINIEHENTLMQLDITTYSSSENIHFYLRFAQRPTKDIYDLNGTVSKNGICVWERAHDDGKDRSFCTLDRFAPIHTFAKRSGKYFFAVESANGTYRAESRKKRSCFGNARERRSCVEVKDPPPTPPQSENVTVVPEYDPTTDNNYTLGVTLGSCVYWSEERSMWLTDGCEVASAGKQDHLTCSCNHLTSFAGSVLISPNPIDFDKVLIEFKRLEETRNVAVIASVVVVFLIYVIVVIFARRADRIDPRENSHPLELPAPSNYCYEYEVIITTGIWRKSGSTARVAMEIYGSEDYSGVLVLNTKHAQHQPLFCRGNRDIFVVRSDKSLGSLQGVRIGHDNAGDSPSWFLEDVTIFDKQADRSWTFPHNRWLALEKEDGVIERVLSLAPNQTAFKYEVSKRWWKGLTESHKWISVATKPSINRFTRVQRASCCLSVLLSAMLANAMFYRLDGKTEQVIQVGPLKFSWEQVVIGVESALIVNPINIVIAVLFQKGSEKSWGKRTCCAKSDWLIYTAWSFCLCLCTVSAIFTIFYSLVWGRITSEQWLASMLISFVQDVVVNEPVKLLFLAALWAAILRRKRQEEPSHMSAEQIDDCSLKKRLFTLHLTKVEEMRRRQTKKSNTARFLLEFVFYVTFVFILMVVCYGNRNDHRYMMTKSIRDRLAQFYQVSNNMQFWDWMREAFLPMMYAGAWYNGLKENQTMYVGDKRSLLVGMPRARQLRVKPQPCEVLTALFPVCFDVYSKANEDMTPFNRPGWIQVTDSAGTSESELYRLCPKPWRYQQAEETDTVPKWGKNSFYPGGGFVADLGYDIGTGLSIVDTLEKFRWLDRQTRVVILSFSTFNPSTNLLAVGTYFYEIQPSGHAGFFERIDVLPLHVLQSGFHEFYLVFILFFIIFVMIYLGRECYNVSQQKCRYFKSFWNWIEIFLVLLSILAVVLYIIRSKNVLSAIQKLQENVYDNISFQDAITWMEVENVILGLLLFLISIKLLRFLRFNYQVHVFARTVTESISHLLCFSFILLIGFIAFLHCGILIFGTETEWYSSPLEATYFQLELVLGKVKARPINDLADANETFGRIFVSMILISLTIIFMNLLTSLLNEMLSQVKNTTIKPELCQLAFEGIIHRTKKREAFFDFISEAMKHVKTRKDSLELNRTSSSEDSMSINHEYVSSTKTVRSESVSITILSPIENNINRNQRELLFDKVSNNIHKLSQNNNKMEMMTERPIRRRKVRFSVDVTEDQLEKLRIKHRSLLRLLDRLAKGYNQEENWLRTLKTKMEHRSFALMDA